MTRTTTRLLATSRPYIFALVGAALVSAGPAPARADAGSPWGQIARYLPGATDTAPAAAAGAVEVAFSPNEGAEALVLKVINSAQRDIKVMTYSFTSVPVVQALVQARKRGVSVTVVADEKNNLEEDRSGKARAALSTLVAAGADVRTIHAYKIAHDKVLVVDKNTVETGSFNFTAAAERSNSENALVLWNNPKLATAYLSHFERNYRQATPYRAQYEGSSHEPSARSAYPRLGEEVARTAGHEALYRMFRRTR